MGGAVESAAGSFLDEAPGISTAYSPSAVREMWSWAWAGPRASVVGSFIRARWTVSLARCHWQGRLASGSPSQGCERGWAWREQPVWGWVAVTAHPKERLAISMRSWILPVCLENRVLDAGLRTAPWSGLWMKRVEADGRGGGGRACRRGCPEQGLGGLSGKMRGVPDLRSLGSGQGLAPASAGPFTLPWT